MPNFVGPFVNKQLPDKAISTIRRFINNPPTSEATVLLHDLGGAVSKVPSKATAYYYRNALLNMSIYSTWSTSEGAAHGIHWVEEFRRAMRPYTKGIYVNTPDLSIKNWPRAYYGYNFERLTKVKAKYDPENIFKFPQSIPPARRK